jgi:hypothetical protein
MLALTVAFMPTPFESWEWFISFFGALASLRPLATHFRVISGTVSYWSV